MLLYPLLFTIHLVSKFFLRFYLFIHERRRERDRDRGKGRSRLHAGSPMWDSIPGLQNHALGQRAQPLSHPDVPGQQISIHLPGPQQILPPLCNLSKPLISPRKIDFSLIGVPIAVKQRVLCTSMISHIFYNMSHIELWLLVWLAGYIVIHCYFPSTQSWHIVLLYKCSLSGNELLTIILYDPELLYMHSLHGTSELHDELKWFYDP